MTDPDNSRQQELSAGQLNAVDVIAVGGTDSEAAEAAGVSRPTVNNWKNHNPHFKAALNSRRLETWGASVDRRVRALIPTALDAIERELTGGPDAYKAALKLLALAGMPATDYRPTGPTDARSILEDEARIRREDEYYGRGLVPGGPITEEEIRRMGEVAELEGRYGPDVAAG